MRRPEARVAAWALALSACLGSQVTQLIARRVRESGVFCEIHPFDRIDEVLAGFAPAAIILLCAPAMLELKEFLAPSSAVFEQGVGTSLLNSLFATTVSTILVLALGIPAAFALSLKPVRKTQDALFFFMSTKMLPIVAAIIPLYVIVSNIGLLDNIWALIILYTSMNLPIAVWMMRSFFLEVPGELLEAASLDGASTWRSVREVILPLVSPGIAATALICVIFAWNEFFFAVNLTAVQAQTMPVFLVGFIAGEGLYWAKLCAAATMAALPVVLAGWIAQNKLVRGLSFGAIK